MKPSPLIDLAAILIAGIGFGLIGGLVIAVALLALTGEMRP